MMLEDITPINIKTESSKPIKLCRDLSEKEVLISVGKYGSHITYSLGYVSTINWFAHFRNEIWHEYMCISRHGKIEWKFNEYKSYDNRTIYRFIIRDLLLEYFDITLQMNRRCGTRLFDEKQKNVKTVLQEIMEYKLNLKEILKQLRKIDKDMINEK